MSELILAIKYLWEWITIWEISAIIILMTFVILGYLIAKIQQKYFQKKGRIKRK